MDEDEGEDKGRWKRNEERRRHKEVGNEQPRRWHGIGVEKVQVMG